MIGTIVQLSISRGGVPKHAVLEARVTALGLDGDKHKNRKLHGGPERALCLYAIEVIEQLRAAGHPIAPGSTGDNITLRGIPWTALDVGDRLALGADVLVEIASLTTPCKTIAGSFADGGFTRLRPHGLSRVYARVVREGVLRPGDRAELLGR